MKSEVDTPDFSDTEQTLDFVRSAFSDRPARLSHILKVADQVRESAECLADAGMSEVDVEEAYRAALLHDIGYLEPYRDTGFHPIDGARMLESEGFPRLARLIGCHTNAPEQAELLGLPVPEISEDLIAKLISYWDSRVMQGGKIVTYEQRLRDIEERHGADSVVVKAHREARPRLIKLHEEVEELLTQVDVLKGE